MAPRQSANMIAAAENPGRPPAGTLAIGLAVDGGSVIHGVKDVMNAFAITAPGTSGITGAKAKTGEASPSLSPMVYAMVPTAKAAINRQL